MDGAWSGQDARSTAEVIASLIVNTQAMVAKEVELVGLELKRIVGRKVAAVAILLVGALVLASVVLLGAMTAAFALESSLRRALDGLGRRHPRDAVLALGPRRDRGTPADPPLVAPCGPVATRRSTGAWLRDLGEELTGAAGPLARRRR
jgi:hypothetical protein